MNRGLLVKSLREIWPPTLGFGLLLMLVEGTLSFSLPGLQSNIFGMILKMDFARTMLSSLMGTPVAPNMGAQIFQALPWVHPLVLLIVFAHVVTVCTRLPAGEIDRGTIDFVLGLPVSRAQLYLHHSLVWALSGWALLLIGLCGNWAGSHLAHSPMPSPQRITIAITNAFCLYFAIGGFTNLICCSGENRGRVIGVVIAVIVASFLINFLAGFWPPAKRVNFLSVLSYYQPFMIFQGGRWPVKDIATLLAAGLALWAAGGEVFRRRDIHTL